MMLADEPCRPKPRRPKIAGTMLFDPGSYGRMFLAELARRGLSYRQAGLELDISYRQLQRIATGTIVPSAEEYLRINRWMEGVASVQRVPCPA